MFLRSATLGVCLVFSSLVNAQTRVFNAEWLFDGDTVIQNARLITSADVLQTVGEQSQVAMPKSVDEVYDVPFLMPGIIAGHSHVGMVQGMDFGGHNYTADVVQRDLQQFLHYGITSVNALGLNRPIFYELRKSLRGLEHKGADLYGAGPGVGAVDGLPPAQGMNLQGTQVDRPQTPDAAREQVRAMAAAGVDMVKVWVDSNGGQFPKMPVEVFTAAIDEAHRHGLKAAAHIHDLEDAKAVVAAGVDVVAHGVRDQPVDQAFIQALVENQVWYVPTINIDEANYLYAENPDWQFAPFFAAGISPELGRAMMDSSWVESALAKKTKAGQAVATNVANLQKIHRAGVNIGFGTDSGATPVRVPGIAEHLELVQMVAAGMTPQEVLHSATAGNADMLGLKDQGRLQAGMKANFLILREDPTKDIRNTRTLTTVWHYGKPVVQINDEES